MTLIKKPLGDIPPAKSKNKNNTIYIVLLTAMALILSISVKTCNNNVTTSKQQKDFINSLSDTLLTYKNKDSDNVATISILKSFSATDFAELLIKDSQIVRLQNIVKQYKGKLSSGSSVTISATRTKIYNKSIPTIVYKDTVIIDKYVYVYPEYKDSLINKWITYRTTINKDSAKFHLEVNNEYATILGYRNHKPYVDVINYNPYSSTTILRSYLVQQPKPKNFGIGLSAGIGVSTNLTPKPYIGIGVQYNIVKF